MVDANETVEVLKSKDEGRMRALAQDEACGADALVVLSQSLSAEIRASVARNASTPKIADELLSNDADVNVRAEVARKVAMRAASEPSRLPEKLRTAALQILTRMIADQEVRVRHVIAEEIKASKHVPKDIAEKLARDEEAAVSSPVLEYSPLLTDEDLIDIIAGYINPETLEAVAKRKPVSATVAERLVNVLDTTAIATLLRNQDANIREDALETIINAAREVEEWHEPLVERPSLSAMAIRRICDFVAGNLINDLAKRPEVDEETRDYLAQKVTSRLESENAEVSDEEAVVAEICDELMLRKRLGRLNAAYISDAAKSRKNTVVFVAFSLLTGLNYLTVRKAFNAQDSKAITALCWKANMPMWLSRSLQELIGKVPARNYLEPTDDGDYPLKASTLEWNFALIADEEDANGDQETSAASAA